MSQALPQLGPRSRPAFLSVIPRPAAPFRFGARDWAAAAVIAAVSAGLQALVIFRQLHTGALSGLIPWDDAAYIENGLRKLSMLAQSPTLASMARKLPWLAPHSGIADVQSTLGLLVSGGQPLAPYALSALTLVLSLGALWIAFRRVQPLLLIAGLMLAVVQPLTIWSLVALKADWKGGLLLATALALYYRALVAPNVRLKLLAASFVGLALTSKLTAFYLPVLGAAVVLLMEGVELAAGRLRPGSDADEAGALPRGDWRVLAASLALATGPFALLFGWAAADQNGLLSYIRYALSGTWTDGMDVGGRIAFYGPFASPDWGYMHLTLVLLAAGALVMAWRARDPRYPLFLAAALVIAIGFGLPLALAGTSNREFAGAFLGVALGAALASLYAFVGGSRVRGAAALALVAALAIKTPLYSASLGSPPKERLAAQRAFSGVVDTILATEPRDEPELVTLFEDTEAPYPNLSIMHFQRSGHVLNIHRLDALDPAGGSADAFDKADYLLTLHAAAPSAKVGYTLDPRFDTSRDLAATERAVEALPAFTRAGAYPWRGGELRLYRNKTHAPPP